MVFAARSVVPDGARRRRTAKYGRMQRCLTGNIRKRILCGVQFGLPRRGRTNERANGRTRFQVTFADEPLVGEQNRRARHADLFRQKPRRDDAGIWLQFSGQDELPQLLE